MASPLTRVFISHAGPDWRVAERLGEDLKAAGNHITVDLDNLGLGDDVVQFMNDGIADADFILIIHSRHTSEAINQIAEVNAAVWNQINQSGAVCIIVRLDDASLPPLLGPKLFVDLNPESEESYGKALETLVKNIGESEHPTLTISKAFAVDGGNPFRRTRAEYFEEDRELLARTFTPPDESRLNKLEDVAPCILEGPRGTGKSMLLISLRARNYLSGPKRERGPSIFGSYLKLTRGALSNVMDLLQDEGSVDAMLQETSSQELFVCVVEAILSEVTYCISNELVECSAADERSLARELDALFSIAVPSSRLEDVLRALGSLRRSITGFLRTRFVYGQNADVPTVAFDAAVLGEAVDAIKREIPTLGDHGFVILLDEYENLYPFQQEIVNGLAKSAAPRFSIKIARKHSTSYPSSTPSGQELQETHDYSRIDLVYNLAEAQQRAAYLNLLDRFVRNVVKVELNEDVTLEGLLPSFRTQEVDAGRRLSAITELCKVGVAEFESWEKKRRNEKITYYGGAATYRCLRGRQRKRFAGHEELAFVSSGVIRYFQEMLAIAYYLRSEEEGEIEPGAGIAPDIQNRAAHLVSAHNLTSLSRNVEGLGEALRFFLLDVGGCLRHKLLKHSSEPEAGRICLRDPEKLDDPGMAELRRVLDAGVREGVFEMRDGLPGFLPRHTTDAQPVEYLICRMFAPVLGISPRARWRTETTCNELLRLVDRRGRLQAIRVIKSRWVREADDKQASLIWGDGGGEGV